MDSYPELNTLVVHYLLNQVAYTRFQATVSLLMSWI
jgi:hypothetical protein